MAKKIRAPRQFSHFHLGTIDSGEVKIVRDDIADALIGMDLAELVEDQAEPVKPKPASKTAKPAQDKK
ncbi:hypothetical protein [Ectopseudomonas mendocina]|uniref:hypothetical protein n=1 Tax=Ectopseudomonas mendocina TaxID=300 RepID=UPI00376EA5A4